MIKAQILSRLGLKTSPFIEDAVGFNFITVFQTPTDFQLLKLNQTSSRIELAEEERETERDFPTKMVRDLLVLWIPISFLGSRLHLCLPR